MLNSSYKRVHKNSESEWGLPKLNGLQLSSAYPAPDTPAIPIQRHFFEMIRNGKKKVQVPSVQ